MIETKPICDSINPQGTECLTMFWQYPKFLHQESLRHRRLYIHDRLYDPNFSFSVSSARAIPFRKLLEEVRSDELRAAPLVWGKEQKGMSPGEELSEDRTPEITNPHFYRTGKTEKESAQQIWATAAYHASRYAEQLADLGVHKSIVNRMIEPFIHVNCLTTGTTMGWMNFFGLRLDKNADPTLQILAQSAWKVWNESKPKLLQPGQWHLPYIDPNIEPTGLSGEPLILTIKVSAARCAQLSYLSFDTNKRSTIEEDLKLYNRLVGGEIIHASPLEHQATPDLGYIDTLTKKWDWENPEQSGNLGLGWRQYRKMLPNESVAPLPPENITSGEYHL